MALDRDEEMKKFFASNSPGKYPITTLVIKHSDLTVNHRFWNQPGTGELNLDGEVVDHRSVNFAVRQAGTNNNLDQVWGIDIDTVDARDEFREQLDLIPIDTKERVRVEYREYLYPDLNTVRALARLQAESLNYGIGKCTVNAVSPRKNLLRTGETYDPRDIPMLEAFQ